MSIPFALRSLATRQDGNAAVGLPPADPDPAVQARHDAEAICEELTDEQRRRAAEASSWGDGGSASFLEHLAAAREEVLRGAAAVPASDREQAPPTAHLPRPAALSGLSRAAAWAALTLFLIMAGTTFALDMQEGDEAPVTVLLLVPILLLAALSAVSGTTASHRRDLVLLDWAVDRPGQLARGIPAAPHITHRDAAATICAGLLRMIGLAIGLMGTLLGSALILIQVLAGDSDVHPLIGPVLLPAALLVGVPAFLWNRRARARLEAEGRLRRALLWIETRTGVRTPSEESATGR